MMPDASDAPHATPGKVIAGKYELVEPLAKGGMGAVWSAVHCDLGTRLAIKFMDPEFVRSDELRGRFKREARAAAALETRHVVRVLDHGLDEGVPYMAMELLAGEDLKTRLRRQRRMSISDTKVLRGRQPRRSPKRMRWGSCTATSSPRTSFSPRSTTKRC